MEALTSEQQAYVDGLVGTARVKARDKANAESAATQTKATDDAAKATLAADAKWEALNAVNEARVKELEPFEAKAKEYDEMVEDMLKTKVKSLGETAGKAIKGLPDGLSVASKLKWLNANEELFQSVGGGVGTPNRVDSTSKDGKVSRKRNFPRL